MIDALATAMPESVIRPGKPADGAFARLIRMLSSLTTRFEAVVPVSEMDCAEKTAEEPGVEAGFEEDEVDAAPPLPPPPPPQAANATLASKPKNAARVATILLPAPTSPRRTMNWTGHLEESEWPS